MDFPSTASSPVSLILSSESAFYKICFRIELENRSAFDLSDVVVRVPVPQGCPVVSAEAGCQVGPGTPETVRRRVDRVAAGSSFGPLSFTVDTRDAPDAAFRVQADASWALPAPGEVSSERIVACPLAPYPYIKKKTVAERGMVASMDPRASAVGVEVLEMGGNAVDAAVATAFAIGVLEPPMSGIGGKGGFMLVYQARTGQIFGLDFNGPAPLKATPEMFLDAEGRVRPGANTRGYLAVCVPSTVAGYALALERFGTMDWRDVMAPSIGIAERGYQVNEAIHRYMIEDRETLARFPATAAIYLRNGWPYETGEWLRPRDLAASYRELAEGGPEAFYRGELGRAIAAEMADHGGLIGMDDLARYRPAVGETTSTSYRGFDVHTCAVNSGGSATLAVLNLLGDFSLRGLRPGSAQAIHLVAEALKVMFADRFEYVGDPDYVKLPLRGLLSREYARERARLIRMDRATCFEPGDPWPFQDRDTTHISVVDRERNMVALTTSLGPHWGSGIVVNGTGILLNGGMNRLDPVPGRANSVAPFKRPLRNSNPALVLKDGKPYMVIGCPGGEKQISSVVSVLVNHLDFGMDLQEAVDAPRFHTQGEELILQSRVPEGVRRQLESMGHELRIIDGYASLARIQAVMIDPLTGKLYGGSDPSAPGAAVGY